MAGFFKKIGKFFSQAFENGRKFDAWKRENSLLFPYVSSLFNKVTGAGLTGAQREQNDAQFALQDDAQRFSASEAEKSWDRYTEFYEKNQSISAQLQQYKDAGVNPFSLGGNVQPQGVSNVGAPQSNSPGLSSVGNGIDIFSAIMQAKEFSLAKERARVDMENSTTVATAQADLFRAEAENLRKGTSWLDSINGAKVREIESKIALNYQKVNESIQSVKESISRVSVNDNTINVQNAQIQMLGSESELNASKKIVENLNAKQLEAIMPFVALRYEAQTERDVYDANIKLLECLKEQKLIDSDYYDNLIVRSSWEAVGAKREYKWKPINDICSNVSKIAVGVGSIVGSGASSASSPAIPTYTPQVEIPKIVLPFLK